MYIGERGISVIDYTVTNEGAREEIRRVKEEYRPHAN